MEGLPVDLENKQTHHPHYAFILCQNA